MSYDFVQAFHDYGVRVRKPTLAFVVHMAEGGGTVGYLAKENPRGVSVHYVIAYAGKIVQMLAESHASGSINPNDLRAGDDADGFYGISHAKAVLGSWWRDPNSVVLTCEVEGFAADGPNAKQAAALVALVRDIRSRYPDIGLLGHRDFTSRKACPGRRIDWAALGGHGVPTAPDTATEDTVTIVNCTRFEPRLFKTKAGLTKLRRFSETAELSPIAAPYSASVDAVCSISQSDDRVPHGEPFYRLATGGSAGFYVLGAQIDVAPEVDDTPYDEADLNLAKQAAAGAERLRWETWVGTRPK